MSPKLRFALLTAGALIGLAATFSLGRWQLSRAAQKEALYAAIQSQTTRPPVGLADLAGTVKIDDMLHRQVRLRGQWVPQNTVFLDNRQMHDLTGFYVVTPLKLAGSSTAILVQRGWVARNFLDRTALPVVESPAGEVEVEGRMAPPPSKLYAFKGVEAGAIRQNLDLADFSAETGLALLPLSVLQAGPAEGRMQRDWPPANLGVEKHYGYAFQWFGLCALIAILYVWFQIVRRFILPPPQRSS
ncbi:MAG: SURF1 family protein [Rhodoferax sp.]|uniref:SURF1 family protein n=1 Tax=Rhodoferax sp. TaxID=50421 RepID=UPI003266609D